MTNTITFRWSTGKIELAACTIPSMTAAQLSALVKTATANAEEVKQQIAEYINEQITFYDEKTERGKKSIEQLKKLLSAAVGERKQTAQEKAISRIIKNCSRAQFTGVFENAGKYCVLDGYRMVRYSAPLDSFPKAPDSLDTERAIGDKSRYNIRLNLPTVKQLKADIKLAKMGNMDIGRIHIEGEGRSIFFLYDFGYGLPQVNAKYLIDMLEAMPDAVAYSIENRTASPIYFVSGDNDGLLFPVRKTQEYESAPVAEAAPVEKTPVESPVSTAEKELEAEREERRRIEEQERIEREQAISEKLAQAEKAIINGGRIENETLDGKLLFLRLFDKYGVKLAIRSRGWVIDKLKSVVQCEDGSATVYRLITRKGEKISEGFTEAYYKLRHILIDAQNESAVDEVDIPADVPVEQAVPVVSSAPVDATQAAETVDTVQSVVAVHPALLRYPGRFKKLSAKADIEPSRGHKPSMETRLCMMNNAFCLNSS